MGERMLKWFVYDHLPENLQKVSEPFARMAETIAESIVAGPERTVALRKAAQGCARLRKLLESKDAAVRAVVAPGG